MSRYFWKPVEESKRPLFAVVKGPYLQACEEVEKQHLVSAVGICEPQRSITPEDIGARLVVNEFEV